MTYADEANSSRNRMGRRKQEEVEYRYGYMPPAKPESFTTRIVAVMDARAESDSS